MTRKRTTYRRHQWAAYGYLAYIVSAVLSVTFYGGIAWAIAKWRGWL